MNSSRSKATLARDCAGSGSGSWLLAVRKEGLMSDDAKKDMFSRRGFLGMGSAALVTVHPGGIRELHWHQNADE